MIRRLSGVLCLLIVSSFGLTACSRPCRDAGKAVQAYNKALILAYRTGEMGPLRAVADDKEVGRVVVLTDLKKSNKIILESSLESFEITSCRQTGPEGAEVETKERWRYYDRPIDPGKSPGQVFVAEMTMRYECQKFPEGWKVIKGRTLTNKYLEPKEMPAEKKGHG